MDNSVFGFAPKKTVFTFSEGSMLDKRQPSLLHQPISAFIDRPQPSDIFVGQHTDISTPVVLPPVPVQTYQPPVTQQPVTFKAAQTINIRDVPRPVVANENDQIATNTLLSDDENNDEKEEVTMEEMESIKTNIRKWLELDDEIVTLQKAALERKKQRDKLNDYIIKFMTRHKTPFFDFSNGQQLILAKTNQKQPLNKNWIQQILHQSLTDEQAKQLETMLLENRPVVEKSKLRRKKPREKKIKN